MENSFILYSSDGCHLCEQALAICHQLPVAIYLTIVDIVDEADLVEQYGAHIPVIQRDSDGEELFWPFDLTKLTAFVSGS